MKLRLCLPVLVAVVAAFTLTVAPAASPATTASPDPSTSGLVQNLTGTVGNLQYDLTATITRFANQGGQLVAIGTVTGTVTNTLTGAITNVNQAFSVPVTLLQANGSCTILDLTLGPLHLDLLGLVIDLNQLHLTITGQTGPGNLLGNLLCGLANALNGNQAGGLARLLNQLLGL
ncbi:MAG TPA: hypothetical protein VF101_05360 [Gaiellaceae bacterium]